MFSRKETIRGIGEPPPVSEPEIARISELARGGEDPPIEDGAQDEAPVSAEPSFPLRRLARSSTSTLEADREEHEEREQEEDGATPGPASSTLADTVRRWTDEDEALALPPRRGGWIVAAVLVASAVGLVGHLHLSSPKPETQRPTSVTATGLTNAAGAGASTEMPALPTTTEHASSETTDSVSNGAPLPTALVDVPATSTGMLVTSLVPSPTPASVTTTTSADTPGPLGTGPIAPPIAAEPISEDLLPLSELLRRAQGSLTEGDRRRAQQRFRLALAKDPSNVEASTGLGDIARSEGDFDAARDHYQRALERSPSFVPALLAFADMEWDLGKRSDAQKKYAALVERLGERAPARAKERKGEDTP